MEPERRIKQDFFQSRPANMLQPFVRCCQRDPFFAADSVLDNLCSSPRKTNESLSRKRSTTERFSKTSSSVVAKEPIWIVKDTFTLGTWEDLQYTLFWPFFLCDS